MCTVDLICCVIIESMCHYQLCACEKNNMEFNLHLRSGNRMIVGKKIFLHIIYLYALKLMIHVTSLHNLAANGINIKLNSISIIATLYTIYSH